MTTSNNGQHVFIVDDDEAVRDALSMLLATISQPCRTFASARDFLDEYDAEEGGCLVLDIRMPGMSGLDLQKELNKRGVALPIIFITGHGDIPMAVEAMRDGALDFIRKPFRDQDLIDRINAALALDAGQRKTLDEQQELLDKIASLSEREREIFRRVADGEMNKAIAIDLGISQRTVEVHRANVMAKLGVRTLADLVRARMESEASEPSADG